MSRRSRAPHCGPQGVQSDAARRRERGWSVPSAWFQRLSRGSVLQQTRLTPNPVRDVSVSCYPRRDRGSRCRAAGVSSGGCGVSSAPCNSQPQRSRRSPRCLGPFAALSLRRGPCCGDAADAHHLARSLATRSEPIQCLFELHRVPCQCALLPRASHCCSEASSEFIDPTAAPSTRPSARVSAWSAVLIIIGVDELGRRGRHEQRRSID